MANFCTKCGSNIDQETGLCQSCDSAELERLKTLPKFCTVCGGEIDKTSRACPNCSGKNADPKPAEKRVKSPKTKNPKKEKSAPVHKSGKSKALTTFLTVLISIFLFITLLWSALIFTIRQATMPSSIENIIENIDIEDTINEFVVFKNKDGDKIKFREYIKIYFEKTMDIEVEESNISSLLKHSLVKEFAVEKIDEYFDALYSGGNVTVTRDEVEDFLVDNADTINKKLETDISEEGFEKLAEKMINEDFEDTLSLSKLKKKIPALFLAVQIGFSYFTLAALLLISALFIFLMFRNSPSQAVLAIGIIFMIIGAIFSLCGLLPMFLPSVWEIICVLEIVGIVLGAVFSGQIIVYGALFALGLLMLIGRKITLALLSKRAAKLEVNKPTL